MRNTKELIAELEQEAGQHWLVQMAIAFENSTIWIRPNEEERLETLNQAILNGGIPVGLIAADKSDGQLKISNRIYPEHSKALEQATSYMERLMAELRIHLENG